MVENAPGMSALDMNSAEDMVVRNTREVVPGMIICGMEVIYTDPKTRHAQKTVCRLGMKDLKSSGCSYLLRTLLQTMPASGVCMRTTAGVWLVF